MALQTWPLLPSTSSNFSGDARPFLTRQAVLPDIHEMPWPTSRGDEDDVDADQIFPAGVAMRQG